MVDLGETAQAQKLLDEALEKEPDLVFGNQLALELALKRHDTAALKAISDRARRHNLDLGRLAEHPEYMAAQADGGA